MKRINQLCAAILIILALLTGIIQAQVFNEVLEHGWGGGLTQAKYCVLDITGNGKLDLLAGAGGKILHYEQESPGSNTFLLVSSKFSNIDVQGFAAPFLIDINGNGLLDLLIGTYDNIWHFEQVATGSLDFVFVTDELLSSGITHQFNLVPVLIDINNNGLLDLLVGNSYDAIMHYEQASQDSYTFNLVSTSFNGIWIDYGGSFCVGHINENNNLDLLAADWSALKHYEQVFPSSYNFELVTYQFGGITGIHSPGPFIIDLNNNGLTDLLVSLRDGKISYYEKYPTHLRGPGIKHIFDTESENYQPHGTNNQQFFTQPEPETKNYGFDLSKASILDSKDVGHQAAPLIYDINNDGLLDLLVGQRDGKIVYYKQTSPGSTQFNLVTENFSQIDAGIYTSLSPTFTDLNGNSKLDLIIGKENGQLMWFEQIQPGSMQFTLISNALPGIGGSGYASPAFADIDNDGLLDLLVGNSNGTITHYKQEIANTHYFTTVAQGFNNIDVGRYSSPVLCDLENDGLLDLLIGNEDGMIYHYRQSDYSSLDFTLVTSSFGGINISTNIKPVVADINGDGMADILAGNYLGGLNLFLQELFIAPIPYNAVFSSCTMPEAWVAPYIGELSQLWSLSESNFAGSYPCELKATPLNKNLVSRLKTNYLATAGIGSFIFEFKHYFADAGSGLTAKVQWSADGENWFDSGWEFQSGGGSIGPETATIEISGVQFDKIRFAFTLDGDHNQFEGWYIDELWIYTNNSVPSATEPITPPQGEYVFNGTPLIWYEVPGATGYTLYFGTDDPPSNIEDGLIVNSNFYQPENYLAEGTHYYWKVIPFNDFGDASGCKTWGFNVRMLNSPADLSAEVVNTDVHLHWTAPVSFYTSILIADLDPNLSSGPKMLSALTSLGLGADYQTSLPEELDAYKSVFVCLGVFPANHILSQPEGTLLANHLTGGGNLYLEGGSTWYFNTPTPVHSMFSLLSPGYGMNNLNSMSGLPNTVTHGLEFTYSGEMNYISHLSPTESAFSILRNNMPIYNIAVANQVPGQYNTIGASFEFGGLVDGQFPNSKQNLMAKYLQIFGHNLKESGSPEGVELLGYHVYRTTDGTSYTQVNTEMITDTFYTDLSLPNGIYYYYVKAQYDKGISIASSVVIAENDQMTLTTTAVSHVSCPGGNDGSATTEPAGGYPPYTYLWSDGQTEATATNLVAGSYTVIVTDSDGSTAHGSIDIEEPFPLASDTIVSLPASCSHTSDGIATTIASGGTPPYTFAWSNGETGETASTLPAGENTVTIIDDNGCEETISFSIDYIRPYDGEAICAVTVNQETGKNNIIWQKTDNVRTIAYKIYREGGASDVYEIIGSTLFSEPSVFIDTLSNPAQQSHRYKIAVVDSCQEESALSKLHKSIHLSMNVGINNEINLLWTGYEGFDYPTHYIMRSVDNGPYLQIGLVPSTNLSFTDVAPPSGYKKYIVEIDMPAGCSLLKSDSRVKSNTVVHDPTGIATLERGSSFRVYPNPGEGLYTIDFTGAAEGKPKQIEVINRLGMVIQTYQVPAGKNPVEINLHEHPNGIYYIRAIIDDVWSSMKVVKL